MVYNCAWSLANGEPCKNWHTSTAAYCTAHAPMIEAVEKMWQHVNDIVHGAQREKEDNDGC